MEDIRAKHNQQRGGGSGNVRKGLQQGNEHALLCTLEIPTSPEMIMALGSYPVRTPSIKEIRMGRGTHLTIYLAFNVKANHVDDHSRKSGHSRQ
jgi:hypothetical protein